MVRFRLATVEDASEYAHILNKSWKDTYGEYISVEHIDQEFNIEELINNFNDYIKNPAFELYMIEYNEKIAGIVELGTYEDAYKDNMENLGEIRSLHIRSEFQKLGIGRATISFALKRLKELNYKTCCVWVKKQNTNAIKFYEKNCFQSTEYSCEQTVDGAPSFVMERNL